MREQLILVFAALLMVSLSAMARDTDYESEIQKLLVVLDKMEQSRIRVMKEYLNKDPIINGQTYQEYSKERYQRQIQRIKEEIDKEIEYRDAVNKNHMNQNFDDIVLDENSDTHKRKEKEASSWRELRLGFEVASRYQNILREIDKLHKGTDEYTADYTYYSDYTEDRTMLKDYEIVVPERLTEKPTTRTKVKANSGKMELLKQKHALHQMQIDAVLRMTGKVP